MLLQKPCGIEILITFTKKKQFLQKIEILKND